MLSERTKVSVEDVLTTQRLHRQVTKIHFKAHNKPIIRVSNQ